MIKELNINIVDKIDIVVIESAHLDRRSNDLCQVCKFSTHEKVDFCMKSDHRRLSPRKMLHALDVHVAINRLTLDEHQQVE